MTPIQQIKAAIRCDEYIGRYLDVRRGKALCPFHNERTPSLQVHEDYWKCFGCPAGGDLITFARDYHGISASDAVRMLADEAGVTLTRQPVAHPYDAAKAERIAAEAAEWRRQMKAVLVEAANRASQLQPPWKCEYIERSPWQPDMLPDVVCEWTRVDFNNPEDVDDYDRILPFLERLESMSRQQLLTAYIDQRTPEQGAALRESIREADLWCKAMTPLLSGLIDRLASAPEDQFPDWRYGKRFW